MKAKWNPAVKAMALRWSVNVDCVGSLRLMTLPFVSELLLGIAVCCPTFRLGTAWTNFAVGSKSGLVILGTAEFRVLSPEVFFDLFGGLQEP